MFAMENIKNRVRIVVPSDLPFRLTGSTGMGETRFELGGLWVTEVDVEAGAGDHRFSFDEPTPAPMDGFFIDGSAGNLQVDDLGNGSPREVEIDLSAGESRVDLDGAWRADAEVSVKQGLGATNVHLPGTHVKVEVDAALSIGERIIRDLDRRADPPPGAPTVRVSVATLIGEIRVR
jgi:predicted membrane protein